MAPGEAIAIAELVIYIPLIFVPLFIAFRHGWVKPIGWIYLAVFCGIRIASAASEIVSTKHQNSTKDAVSAAILNAVGICPLLLASFALLERVYVKHTSNTLHNSNHKAELTGYLHPPSEDTQITSLVLGPS